MMIKPNFRELRSESTCSKSDAGSSSPNAKLSKPISSFFQTLNRQNKEATAEKLNKYTLLRPNLVLNEGSARYEGKYISLKND